jgi:uncharacterized DUF497 family protein
MRRTIIFGVFEWDSEKEEKNLQKHGVNFEKAAMAFLDPKRLIIRDEKHSQKESRYFCLGKIGDDILTVRFMKTSSRIRIIGAGNWRKERKIYEEKNKDRSR